MVVCLCHNLNDKKLKELARQGHDVQDVRRLHKAGSNCGMCVKDMRRILSDERTGGPAPAARYAKKRED